MMEWEHRFQSEILARGLDYFASGRVEQLEHSVSSLRAWVRGSKTYQVSIEKDGLRVKTMYCNCPYAASGESCKHMAAALYAWSEELRFEPPQEGWQSALEQLSADKMRDLLASLAVNDRYLQERIVRALSAPEKPYCRHRTALREIASRYTGADGWIEDDDTYDCMTEFADYLNEQLAPLLESGQVLDAAQLIVTVYDEAYAQDPDNVDCGLSFVSDTCRKALGQTLALADEEQEREIFALFSASLQDDEWEDDAGDWDDGAADWEALLVSQDWSEDIARQLLAWLDEHPNNRRMTLRVRLMKKMGASEAEVIAWWEDHRESTRAYQALLGLYEENDLSKAIELVQEQREQAEDIWSAAAYTKTLLLLLEKAGEQARYETELKGLVLGLRCRERDYLLRLKAITSDREWKSIFRSLVKRTSDPSRRMELYYLDEKYDLLIDELENAPPTSPDFWRYEAELREWDVGWTLGFYVEKLKREMEAASDRERYREVISRLRGLNAYPNGKQRARQLAAYWYARHNNRPAMKAELRAAGYTEE